MLSLRLKTIASFLEPSDKVADIGADHGYLGIYATQNNLVKSIILTDIKSSALESAKKNVAQAGLKIPLVVTAGLAGIATQDLNTLVISGMGTSTILEILDPNKLQSIDKLILQSNNNLAILRKQVTSLGYQLMEEKTIFDNGFWYVVCLFKKNPQAALDETTIKYGFLTEDKIPYYEYLLHNAKSILNNIIVNNSETKTKKDLENEIIELTTLLEKSRHI